jgi:hypothetical protein
MTPTSVLDSAAIARFNERGAVNLPDAFPRDAALAMQEATWGRLQMCGIERHDRSTWGRPPPSLRPIESHPAFKALISPRLFGAMDNLLGAGCWKRPRNWGHFLVSFPHQGDEPWTVPLEGWRLDWPVLDRRNGLFVFLLFGDIAPRSGATLLDEGSRRAIERFASGLDVTRGARSEGRLRADLLQSHPWLRSLTSEQTTPEARIAHFISDTIDDAGQPLRVIEACGAAGDAWLCHASILHCGSLNCGDMPRFMRGKVIGSGAQPVGQSRPGDADVA